MAINQGAPGVRIQLIDQSEVNLTSTPIITGGVVGYSTRGEFNKILRFGSTGTMDALLGSGFNLPRYNQGLYAARGVLNSGGVMEYVRPYGEDIITDDNDPAYPYNQTLKTDTFLVDYNYNEQAETNLDISFYAATRYIQDGLQQNIIGSASRIINGIDVTLQTNSNINFSLDADAEDDGFGTFDKIPLFAIMNTDPSSTKRAGDPFAIASISYDSATTTVTVISVNQIPFSVGQIVTIGGTTNFNNPQVIVTTVTNNNIQFTYNATLPSTTPSENVGVVWANFDEIGSGIDYLNVNTVARGQASKQYDWFEFKGDFPTFVTESDFTNTAIKVVQPDTSTKALQLYRTNEISLATAAHISYASGVVTVNLSGSNLAVGDTITINAGDVAYNGTFLVSTVTSTNFTYEVTLPLPLPSASTANVFGVLSEIVPSDSYVKVNEVSMANSYTVTTLLASKATGNTFELVDTSRIIVGDILVFSDTSPTTLPSPLVAGTSYAVSSITTGNLVTLRVAGSATDITATNATLLSCPVSKIYAGKFTSVVSSGVNVSMVSAALFSIGDFVKFSDISWASSLAATTPVRVRSINNNIVVFEALLIGIWTAVSQTSVVNTVIVTNLTKMSSLRVNNVGSLTVGDIIEFKSVITPVSGGAVPILYSVSDTQYVIGSINGNYITLNQKGASAWTSVIDGGVQIGTSGYYFFDSVFTASADDVSATLRNFQSSLVTLGWKAQPIVRSSYNGTTSVSTANNTIIVEEANRFHVGDIVMLTNSFLPNTTLTNVNGGFIQPPKPFGNDTGTSESSTSKLFKISNVNLSSNALSFSTLSGDSVDILTIASAEGVFQVVNLTTSQGGLFNTDINTGVIWDSTGGTGGTVGKLVARAFVNGRYSLTASSPKQTGTFFILGSSATTFATYLSKSTQTIKEFYIISTTSNGIVIDSSIGRQFLALGLAKEEYADINYDGISDRVYVLTSAGQDVAKVYLFVNYFFKGETYEMAGTIVPFVFNNNNLYIGNTAEAVQNGFQFIVNESSAIANGLISPLFDLSTSKSNGILTSRYTDISFNPYDPAVLNNAIWFYDPAKNATSGILGNAWNLFLNKDVSNVDMLIAAGTAISNLFVRNAEQIDFNVMNSILGICEKRKDCFSIFDGLGYSDVAVVLRLMVGIGGAGDLARWGAIYDGRSIMNDSVYTKLNVEIVQSVVVAQVITANRSGGIWWIPPAGYINGRISQGMSRRQKYPRSYNYAEDPFSDVAKLYDANINPFRTNDQGQFVYGQKTMLRRLTALNRLNVIMLVAGIHKRFAAYLDNLVFQLNTPALRKNIQSDLQFQLNSIGSSTPPGLTSGIVICDGSNNPPIIIDTNQLIVDVIIQPTRAAEFITLRTTVQRTGAGTNNTASTIVGG